MNWNNLIGLLLVLLALVIVAFVVLDLWRIHLHRKRHNQVVETIRRERARRLQRQREDYYGR